MANAGFVNGKETIIKTKIDIMIVEAFIKTIEDTIPIFDRKKVPQGFQETIDLIFKDGFFVLDRERINILLSYWHLPPMEKPFFNHYFKKNIESIDEFKLSIREFIIDALWHFGDLERAYIHLSQLNDVDGFIKRHQFDISEFKDRLPWRLVEFIPPQERGYLGYVSGQRPKKEQELLSFAEEIIKEIEDNRDKYENVNKADVTDQVLNKLSQKHPEIRSKIDEFNKLRSEPLDLFSSANLEATKEELTKYKEQISQTIQKVEVLKEVGKRNQEHFLRNIESIDVYVATSMRNDEEYKDMYDFVTSTFKNDYLKELNLRYFDPTLCYCDSRIDKGIIECLLVRSTKVTIYCAQEGDTFGKDSELAATLAQGKPVIVYVPSAKETDADIAKIADKEERLKKLSEKSKKLNSRASTFKDYHPLGLQVGLYDGVARGVIVVRDPEQCAQTLYKILTNSLEVEIKFEQHGIVLREKETESVVRVMTGWGTLASAFWNQFKKTQNPKSGLPD